MEAPQAIATWSKISETDRNQALELPGKLVILWEDISDRSVPISGMAHYYPAGYDSQYTKVWFLGFNFNRVEREYKLEGTVVSKYSYKTAEIDYVLYCLSESSDNLAEQEHSRFVQEVGHIKDYGGHYTIDHTKGTIRFKRNNLIQDLEVQILGKVSFTQLANPNRNTVVVCPSFPEAQEL